LILSEAITAVLDCFCNPKDMRENIKFHYKKRKKKNGILLMYRREQSKEATTKKHAHEGPTFKNE